LRSWFGLGGKKALVVGASQGLGREIAIGLAKAGSDVACAARNAAGLQNTVNAVRNLGREAVSIPTDVTQEQQIAALIHQTNQIFGRIDILIYCAGMMYASSSLEMSVADWETVLKTNLTGAFVSCRETAKTMKRHGSGRIILVGSAFAQRVLPYCLAYVVSKAGLSQMIRNLSFEWARYGIRVNGIAPGYFDTDMPAAVLGDAKSRETVLNRIPLKRVGDPPEIAPLAVYLAGDACGYMTGEIICMDGGQVHNTS
jgi:NAD(P)-dependent dehydrogenase (short-subunit alcohol dehydrogenase family)